MLSITSIAFAAGGEGSDNAPQFDPIFELIENIAEVPQNDASSAVPDRTVINQGDTISVATDSTEVSDILEAYQEHNNFRIYFPKIDDTSDGISVTCLDVVQYDSSGEIIQQAERQ